MTKDHVKDCFWRYYVSLEKQIIDLERYIEFDLRINHMTYSSEILKLYQAVCSEIDVIGKSLASQVNPTFVSNNRTNIRHWWFEIQQFFNGIQNEVIIFKARNESIIPWKNFYLIKRGSSLILDPSNGGSAIPHWWTSYNKVKHERAQGNSMGILNYTRANLKNLICASAGLFLLEILLIEKVGSYVEESPLFSCRGHKVFVHEFGFVGE